MNTSLENILRLETGETHYIHLHQCAPDDLWTAYDASALRLVEIVPQLKAGLTEEVFPDSGARLYCVRIDSEQMIKYGLAYHCTLLTDNYMRLQETPVPELAAQANE